MIRAQIRSTIHIERLDMVVLFLLPICSSITKEYMRCGFLISLHLYTYNLLRPYFDDHSRQRAVWSKYIYIRPDQFFQLFPCLETSFCPSSKVLSGGTYSSQNGKIVPNRLKNEPSFLLNCNDHLLLLHSNHIIRM